MSKAITKDIVDGIRFVQYMMEKNKWSHIDAEQIGVMANAIFVLENPYEIEGKPASNHGIYQGMELLHKMMTRRDISTLDEKHIKFVLYAITNYDELFHMT